MTYATFSLYTEFIVTFVRLVSMGAIVSGRFMCRVRYLECWIIDRLFLEGLSRFDLWQVSEGVEYV